MSLREPDAVSAAAQIGLSSASILTGNTFGYCATSQAPQCCKSAANLREVFSAEAGRSVLNW